MSLEYSKAKNESLTCKYNNIFLHSSYNPQNEAERFVQNLNPDYTPENILIIEPALSYCAPYLRKKFPSSNIYAIRFIKDIQTTERFDDEFYFSDDKNLEDQLFNYFGESGLLNSFFITWPPSSKAFSDNESKVWSIIKKVLKQCQDILATRQYFSERWIKNQINYFSNLTKVTNINKIDLPVLICGSGPSLKNCLNFIKTYSDHFFIIACSSSIKPLIKNGVTPDLCISTDGGYWAKKHLTCLKNTNSIIALPSEANIDKNLLKDVTVLPLAYCDNYDDTIFESLKISFIKAKRNGTVTGTALELALSITENKILLCGIDLEASSGYVHTQPNELESSNSLKDNRIRTKEKRIFIQGLETPQLDIYRNWFINNSANFENRVFRLYENHIFIHTLGKIKDIQVSDVKKMLDTKTISDKKNIFNSVQNIHCTMQNIKNIFTQLSSNPVWIENYFPADCMMIKRYQKTELEQKYKIILKEKTDRILSFIQKQAGE